MNTIKGDVEGLHDSLETTGQLVEWLAALRATGPAVSDADTNDLHSARHLRDALRRLAALVTEDPRQNAASPLDDAEAAVAAVNEIAAKRPAEALAIHDGSLVSLSAPVGSTAIAALADIALEARALFTGPDAVNLRPCLAPGCVRYFMKSHPRREWCAPACGNRVRAARHYDRVRANRGPRTN